MGCVRARRPCARAKTLPRELTARALLVGCGLGLVLAAGNVYTGLKTSFIDGGSITAAALGAMAVTWFRDGRPQLIPQVTLLGTTVAGVSTAALTLGVSWSPLMLSTGVLIGPRNAASMLAGAMLSWALVVPRLVGSGVVA